MLQEYSEQNELKIADLTDLGNGLRMFSAPYVSLREPVFRIVAGDLIPSDQRKEFPEIPEWYFKLENRFSGSSGFADFKISKEEGYLSIIVLAVEPHARGSNTFFQILRALELHAESLGLSSIRVLDVINDRLAKVFPALGYSRGSSLTNIFHKTLVVANNPLDTSL